MPSTIYGNVSKSQLSNLQASVPGFLGFPGRTHFLDEAAEADGGDMVPGLEGRSVSRSPDVPAPDQTK